LSEPVTSSTTLDPHGQVVLVHREVNELEIGQACYDPGDRVGVVHTPWAPSAS
jgi:hypothetical protein